MLELESNEANADDKLWETPRGHQNGYVTGRACGEGVYRADKRKKLAQGFMTKKEFISLVSKIHETGIDEFKAEYNSPELLWEKVLKQAFAPPSCPVCGMRWYSDCDQFGCWSCGYEKEEQEVNK